VQGIIYPGIQGSRWMFHLSVPLAVIAKKQSKSNLQQSKIEMELIKAFDDTFK
jgi:hypothetical protein